MPASEAGSDAKSFNSFNSSLSGRSFFGKLAKYELKRKFYEKLEDFKNKVLLHKEPGFVVYRARCAYSGGVVVLKGYSRETLTLQTRQRVWNEVQTLQNAHCPFILKCFDSFEDQGWWWLVLENCAAGDLYRIVQATGRIQEEGWLASQVLLPLLQTLAYLHNEGIIHRDIKPEHVLFNSERVAKLSGFFLAQDVSKFGFPKDMVGTLDYVAPEVFRLTSPEHAQQAKAGLASSTYDYKVDVWMLGILTFDVLVGRPPFNADTPNATVERILLEDPEFPDHVTDDAADFILCCLTKEPDQRPSARQLLSHPWIKDNIAWVPPDDFEDPVPEMDPTYYEGGRGGEDAEVDFSDDGEAGPKSKWYDPRSWFARQDSEAGFEEFKGEGARGGIQSGVVSFARKLLGGKNADEQQQQANGALPAHLLSPRGNGVGPRVGSGSAGAGGSGSSKGVNKGGNERFVKGAPPPPDEDELEEDMNGRVSDDGEAAAPVQFRPHEHVANVNAHHSELTPRSRLPPLQASPRTVAGPLPAVQRTTPPEVPSLAPKMADLPNTVNKDDDQLILTSAREFEQAGRSARELAHLAPPPPPVPVTLQGATPGSRAVTPVPQPSALGRKMTPSPQPGGGSSNGRSPSPAPAAAGLSSPTAELPGSTEQPPQPAKPPSRAPSPLPADAAGAPPSSSSPQPPATSSSSQQPAAADGDAGAVGEAKSGTPPTVPKLRGMPGAGHSNDGSAGAGGGKSSKPSSVSGRDQSPGKDAQTVVEAFSGGCSTARSDKSGMVDPATGERYYTPRVAHPRKWS
mmetsp:Transcript_9250/g.22910  ORF Transcript_9250/g.22910 Transcript_9250/m.22910 type:complete len:797 (-) Transcript_9250:542-2932(-)